MNVSIKNKNSLLTNNILYISFPQQFYSSSRGPTIDNSILNTVTVSKITLIHVDSSI